MRFETAVPLGRGATGEVLKAWDPRLERWVALKFLRSDDPHLVARMQREARLQARLRHPNVAEVYDVGKWEGRPFIAMQLIEGLPLDQAVRDLPLEQRVRLLAVVAHAVHAAHAEGLIHRDLKPGNILVETGADGVAVPFVLDFGIAREIAARGETLTGQMLGTPGYLSPEQARGETERLDRRSDVFSLGVMLYEALTGARPFGGDSAVDALVQVLERDPVPPRRRMPGLPRDLETILLKALEKDPDRRYGSARELGEDLERFLRGDPIAARRPGGIERLARKALASTPWLYEAELLAGAVHQRQAQRLQQAGDRVGAVAALDRAQEAFERAARLAPSAEAVHSALCDLAHSREHLLDQQGFGTRPDLYAGAEAVCRAALASDSDAPRAYKGLLELFAMRAGRLRSTGREVEEVLAEAFALAREAERRGFVTADISHALGALHLTRAEAARLRGEDPKPLYIEAEAFLQRAAARFPEDLRFLDALGFHLLFRMDVEPPGSPAWEGAYARAEKALLRAAELNPRSGSSLSGLSLLYLERGRAERLAGADPRPFLAKAVAVLDRAAAVEAHPVVYLHLGLARAERAYYERATGGDPVPHFEGCLEAHGRSLALNADFIPAQRQLAHCRAELGKLRSSKEGR